MHPSDENQASFKQPGARPNLMSSTRRGGHEDSILARLDGEPGARGGSGARLAWYGTAALIAVGLTATLAWLAAGTGQPALELARGSEVRMVQPQPVVTAPARVHVAPAPRATARTGSAAVIVDAPPASSPDPAPLAPPPAVPVPQRLPAPVAAADTADTAKPAPARALTPARARPAPSPRPAPRQAARPARGANEASVDSDVALISAVIFHANGHAASQDDTATACADDSCRPRPAR